MAYQLLDGYKARDARLDRTVAILEPSRVEDLKRLVPTN